MLAALAIWGIAPPTADQWSFKSMEIAGRCMEETNGAWLAYSGQIVPRTDPDDGRTWIYGKVLKEDLPKIGTGEVQKGAAGAFAVVFPELSPDDVKGNAFRLQGISEHLAMDKAGRSVRGKATCDLRIVRKPNSR